MKKIISKTFFPIAWTLDRLYTFRTQHCFLIASEVRKVIAANDDEKIKLGARIKAFSDSVVQLVHARCKRGYHGYELRFHISKDALETAVGENEAIGAIVVPLARLIIERHKKSKEEAKQNGNQRQVHQP